MHTPQMYKISPLMYRDYILIAEMNQCGRVYPLSIAEEIQDGEIFTGITGDYNNVLFWSQSGFAYLSPKADRYFLEEIYDFMQDGKPFHSRRFLLLTCDEAVEDYFRSKEDVILEKRIETSPKYRRRGLGTFAAAKMIQYTIERGKKPVWACHSQNTASAATAVKLGFVKKSECSIIRHKEKINES